MRYLTRNSSDSGRWSVAEDQDPSPGLQKACALANWIEENLWILTKARGKVRLRFNPSQEILLDYLAECWHHSVPVNALCPKFRQGGVSTFWQAVFFAMATTQNGYRAAVLAHVEESASEIFGMSRRFDKWLPRQWQRGKVNRQHNMFVFDNDSAMYVGTAKSGDAAFRGYTLNGIHGSEVANWADNGVNPENLWSAVRQSLAKNDDTICVLESTAKGRDPFFYETCERSRKGENDYRVLFLPWYLDPGYRLTWEEYVRPKKLNGFKVPAEFVPTAEEELLRYTVRNLVATPAEVYMVHPHEITDEQLIWRRRTLEMDCGGDLGKFQREYPSTYEECWAATTNILFPEEVLQHYRESSEPGTAGDVVRTGAGEAVFTERRGMSVGYLTRWAAPVKERQYVIGADVSAGYTDSDYACAQVIDSETLEQVCEFHGHINPDQFADYLFLLGQYYNWAKLAVESNFAPSVALRLRQYGYPNLHFDRNETAIVGKPSRVGWYTTEAKRESMLTRVIELTRVPHPLKLHSRPLVGEMGTFVYHEKKGLKKGGRYEAAHGKHDDRVMALMIALMQLEIDADRFRAPQAQTVDEERARYLAWINRVIAEQKRERERRRFHEPVDYFMV